MLPCGCNNGAEYMAKTTNNSFALLLLPCATRYRSMRDRMTIILVLAQPNVCKIWAIQVGCNMIPITDKSDNNKLILKHLEIKSVVLSEETDMELTTSQVTWWHVWQSDGVLQVLLVSRSLVASFVTLLTLWYFISPYLLTSSQQFTADLWGKFP